MFVPVKIITALLLETVGELFASAPYTDLFLEAVDELFANCSYYTKWWMNSNVVIRRLCEFFILIII